jgi:hypothetical protein
LAERGHHVTAIHTDPEMVQVANDWARHFRFPFKAVCADLTQFTFARETFDSFFIDSYGSLPSTEQNMMVQRNLANAISDQGVGFVVARRKEYASHWFLMNKRHSIEMTKWLMKQAPLDFYYSKSESTEERLFYGAYNRSYTTETLSSELSHTFDVLDCLFDKHDPRYVMAVVHRKGSPEMTVHRRPMSVVRESEESWRPHVWLMSKIKNICDILRIHERRVSQYFDNRHQYGGKNPLQAVDTDLSAFIDVLTEVFETIPPMRMLDTAY